MNSRILFQKRLLSEWKYQYNVIRSVLDWTVILYIVIPAIAIFIANYRSWWNHDPVWLDNVPLQLFIFLGYILIWFGNYRTYILEADKVFLIKNKPIYLGMKRWGFFYSAIIETIIIGLWTIVILPFFLRHFHLNAQKVFVYFTIFLSMKYIVMNFKIYLRQIDRKIIRIFYGLTFFLVMGGVAQLIFLSLQNKWYFLCPVISVFFGGAGILLRYRKIPLISLFEIELEIEKAERLKNIHVIYQFSSDIEKTSTSSRRKPLILKNSKVIFKKRTAVNGFMELFLKVFIRKNSYWFTYLQMVSVTVVAAIVIPPIWIKAIIFIGFSIMMISWLEMVWSRIMESNTMIKKYVERDAYFSAKKITTNSLFGLSIFLLTIEFIIGLFIINL